MKQKFIEWFTKNNNGCSPAMEDDRSFVYEMTQHMFEAYQAGVAEGEARCAALAAENAGLKAAIETHKHGFVRCNCCGDELMCHTDDVCRALDETPATDAFLAEVRAQGVEMLVKHCEQKALEKSYDFFMDAGAVAAQFAAQLRQEAVQ
ncbi:TPA: hypothetical protein N5L07_003482 [Enterobacter asburiae]|nr:hypothetical protein [Enterobacter asburiae]